MRGNDTRQILYLREVQVSIFREIAAKKDKTHPSELGGLEQQSDSQAFLSSSTFHARIVPRPI